MSGQRSYKGYVGVLRIDDEANVIRGKVINTKDTITFQGKSVEDAVAAFHDSVDDYLAFCESLGEPPEKPFSGRVLVRLKPEVHRILALAAQSQGTSFNKLVSHALAKEARKLARIGVTAGPTEKPTGPR